MAGRAGEEDGYLHELATIDEMETLWYELQREMTESGKIVRFPAR